MSHSQYLLRFDDICPTMNWKVWNAIEEELRRHRVRPILAVVPDNVDPGLMVDAPDPDFWGRVKRWQDDGYTIALHGYQHRYINREKGLMKLTPHSEFTGLPYLEQAEKLRKGLEIFAQHGIRADAFVAPSHSFDRMTLRALADLGLRVICDGLWPRPHQDDNEIFWVPQQLWRFRARRAGVWTVCLHLNHWNEKTLAAFRVDLARHADQMTDVATLLEAYQGRRLTTMDRIGASINLVWYHRIVPWLASWKKRLLPAGTRA
jgi:predicted deacetylase